MTGQPVCPGSTSSGAAPRAVISPRSTTMSVRPLAESSAVIRSVMNPWAMPFRVIAMPGLRNLIASACTETCSRPVRSRVAANSPACAAPTARRA
ncbi:hypothetical protein QW131_24610 [Roseibium salinum]|nr:hypothetical protein [Roseibium salinum]